MWWFHSLNMHRQLQFIIIRSYQRRHQQFIHIPMAQQRRRLLNRIISLLNRPPNIHRWTMSTSECLQLSRKTLYHRRTRTCSNSSTHQVSNTITLKSSQWLNSLTIILALRHHTTTIMQLPQPHPMPTTSYIHSMDNLTIILSPQLIHHTQTP